MSMIHYAYLFDWEGYKRAVNGPKRNASRLEDWLPPLEALRTRLRTQELKSFPEWRLDLDERASDWRDELLSPKTRIKTLEQVRNLHFLALTDFCRAPGKDYQYWWDTLKTALGKILGQEPADILTLGVRWEGPAWDFMEGLISYQFGFVLPEDLSNLLAKVEGVTTTKFKEVLPTIDWKGTYGCHGKVLDEGDEAGTLEALESLKSNLLQARSSELGLFYILD